MATLAYSLKGRNAPHSCGRLTSSLKNRGLFSPVRGVCVTEVSKYSTGNTFTHRAEGGLHDWYNFIRSVHVYPHLICAERNNKHILLTSYQ